MEATALSGIVVADFSRVLAGPYASMLLGDLGADVIKLERPGTGDDTRQWGPPWASDGLSTYFHAVNRNKTTRAFDLNQQADRDAVRVLCADADVVIENYRPGTMARFGLDYESLSSVNPGLVYCSVTGFGATGGASLPGYDLLVQAAGGLMSVTGEPDGPPLKAGVALVDVICGLHAVTGILAVLRHRDLTGMGQRVEVNLLSSALSAMTNQALSYVGADVVPRRMGNLHPSISPYESFETADDTIVLAAANDTQFERLSGVLDLAWMPADPRFATNPVRVHNRVELHRLIEDRLRMDSASRWTERLRAVGLPVSPVNDMAGAIALAEELGLEPVVELTGPYGQVRQLANPIRLSRTPAAYRQAPQPIGAAPGIRESLAATSSSSVEGDVSDRPRGGQGQLPP